MFSYAVLISLEMPFFFYIVHLIFAHGKSGQRLAGNLRRTVCMHTAFPYRVSLESAWLLYQRDLPGSCLCKQHLFFFPVCVACSIH